MYQANYFYALSRKSSAPALSVSIIPFTGQGRPEDRMGSILRAMDEVRSIEPEIIMLYATRESTELFLQQVIPDVALFSVSTMFFKTFDFDQKIQYLFFFFLIFIFFTFKLLKGGFAQIVLCFKVTQKILRRQLLFCCWWCCCSHGIE